MPEICHITIASDEDGIRLDRWLRVHFPNCTYGYLARLLRKGSIRLDGGRVKPAVRVHRGQSVRIPPELSHAMTPEAESLRESHVDSALASILIDSILYRDTDMLAINKPAGIAVQGGSGLNRHIDAVLGALQFDAPVLPRLVHRLDKETSGVLVLARHRKSAQKLTAQFTARTIHKTYWALVYGMPSVLHARITEPIEGREAVSDYSCRATTSDHSWLEISPQTGRKHQIRSHLAAIGHPIIGDSKYRPPDGFTPHLGCRLQLHARTLCVPGTNGVVEIIAPIPHDMLEMLNSLKLMDNNTLIEEVDGCDL